MHYFPNLPSYQPYLMINKTILRNLRTGLGKTQQEMADELFVAQSTYSRYESGKSTPPLEIIKRIVEKFGIDLHSLLGVKGHPPSPKSKSIARKR